MADKVTPVDYIEITETSGDAVSQEQFERICHRYYWAGTYCGGKAVLEAACGTGQGLGYLSKRAKYLTAGDFSADILEIAKQHYQNRAPLSRFDAQSLPYPDHSLDVVILFEAMYYLPSAERFVAECLRVLKQGGVVLIATANKDLFDFNPSPHSYRYFGVVELEKLFSEQGFSAECFGCTPVDAVSLRQRLFRPVKKLVVQAGLMPKTASGKKFLKRLVFGQLVTMPAEIAEGMMAYHAPEKLPPGQPDRTHKVIYCAARMESKNELGPGKSGGQVYET